jgi:hypothetical protein
MQTGLQERGHTLAGYCRALAATLNLPVKNRAQELRARARDVGTAAEARALIPRGELARLAWELRDAPGVGASEITLLEFYAEHCEKCGTPEQALRPLGLYVLQSTDDPTGHLLPLFDLFLRYAQGEDVPTTELRAALDPLAGLGDEGEGLPADLRAVRDNFTSLVDAIEARAPWSHFNGNLGLFDLRERTYSQAEQRSNARYGLANALPQVNPFREPGT